MSLLRSKRAYGFTAVLIAVGCTQTPLPPESESPGGAGGVGGTGSQAAGAPSAGAGGVAGAAAPVAGSAGSPLAGTGGAGVPSAGGTTGGSEAAGSAGIPSTGGAAAGTAGAGGSAGGVGGAGGMQGGAGAGGDLVSAGSGGGGAGAGSGGGGTGGTSAGAGGSGGGSAMPCPNGCAEASVPFTAWQASQAFEIYLNAATDLSTATVSVKARKVAGKAGGIQVTVKNGSAQMYAYAQSSWYEVNTLTAEWQTLTLDLTDPDLSTDPENTFVPSAVAIVGFQLAAGDPWYTDESMTTEDPTALVNPTVIQVDEIAITGTSADPAPWTFTNSVSPLVVNISESGLMSDPPYAVQGSTITFVGP
jgi:hypothetical protein